MLLFFFNIFKFFSNLNKTFQRLCTQIFNTGCFVSVANEFGAPIVGITSTSLYPWYGGMVGDVVTPSYVPVNLLPFTSKMSFVQRLINAITLITVKMYYTYKYEPEVSVTNSMNL